MEQRTSYRTIKIWYLQTAFEYNRINNQTLLTDEHRTELISKELDYCFEEAKKKEKEEKIDKLLQEQYDDVNRYRIIQRIFKKIRQ